MKIIVIGATGFVGTNILPLMADMGHEIYAIQRKPHPGKRNVVPGVRWMMLTELLDQPSGLAADAILSIAGGGEPVAFETDPAASLSTELKIADFVSDLAFKLQIPKIICLSSGGAIYGEGWQNGQRLVFDENDICRPVSTYGKCKLAAEGRLTEQLDSVGLLRGLTILRASNIYGLHYAKGGSQGLVNTLVQRALALKPITVYGDGLVYRDYIFISDLADAISKSLQTDAAGIFNIATGHSHSILDVIEQVETATGYCFEKQFELARGIDVKYSALSIGKAQRFLGWNPAVSLEKGIRLALNFRRGLGVLEL